MAITHDHQAPDQHSEHQDRLVVGGVALLGVGAVVALALLGGRSSFEPTPPATPAALHSIAMAAADAQVSVVHVDAGGNAVIAGRAAPGAKVTVTANGRKIGDTKADSAGGFTFVTSKPLDSGQQNITLSSRDASGAEQATAHGVTVDVPAVPNEGPLAVLTGKSLGKGLGIGFGSSLLGGERPDQAPNTATLALGSVDYSGLGGATFAGTAPAGNRIALLMGTVTLGQTMSGAHGKWKLHVKAMPRQLGQFHLTASRT